MTAFPAALPQPLRVLQRGLSMAGNSNLASALDGFLTLPQKSCFHGAYALIEFPLARLWVSPNSDFDLRLYGIPDQDEAGAFLDQMPLKYHILESTDADAFPAIDLLGSRHIGKIENGLFLRIFDKGFRLADHPYASNPLPLSAQVQDFIHTAREQRHSVYDPKLSSFDRIDLMHDLILAACLENRYGLVKPKWRIRAASDRLDAGVATLLSLTAQEIGAPSFIAQLEQRLIQLTSDIRQVRWTRWYALDCLEDYKLARASADSATAMLCLSDTLKQAVACLSGDYEYCSLETAWYRLHAELVR